MAIERTLSIVKPDGVEKNIIGEIYRRFEQSGLQIIAARMMHLSPDQAGGFYAVHKERPFYNDLVSYMMSGPVWVIALERDGAVKYLRDVMGDTNSQNAAEGTIRNLYGESIERNAIHGSDSPENAAKEIAFFFSTSELV